MQMLKKKALKPERGDVIVFNNTSAEHPATYEFTRKMKALAEEKYNIPFFWIEYQTYEDAGRYGWSRQHSYRLVNETPYSDENKNGYFSKGEVFEELVSVNGFLPNMQTRSCTLAMKIFITNAFLTDWLAQKSGIERLGHFGDATKMTGKDFVRLHKANGGETPDKILIKKRKFVSKRNFIREEAYWKDFTKSNLCFNNDAIKDSVIAGKAQLFGDKAVDYISCLGIRKDEEIRAEKIRDRIHAAKKKNTESKSKNKSLSQQPPGESILASLIDDCVGQEDVLKFWKRQKFDLDLPGDGIFSNCVYCPLKGKSKLLKIATEELSGNGQVEGTPASIDWWVEMERKYRRNLEAEERTITSEKGAKFIGFFGVTNARNLVYQQIKKQAQRNNVDKIKSITAEFLEDESYVPCNCTD